LRVLGSPDDQPTAKIKIFILIFSVFIETFIFS